MIQPGGHIFMAFLDERAIGCCALIPMEPGVFEVAKMAVDERYRGRGVGRKMLSYTIEQAQELGASVLYLETNRKLKNAIHLYESLGFQHLPPKQSPYARANVFMELRLGATTDLRGQTAKAPVEVILIDHTDPQLTTERWGRDLSRYELLSGI